MSATLKNPNSPATPKQCWALFCATKQDFRNNGLTMQQAYDMLKQLNETKERTMSTRDSEFARIVAEANAAGERAGKEWMDAALARGPAYAVIDEMAPGRPVIDTMLDVCGFAWLEFTDKRSAFYKWYKKNGGRSSYSMDVNTSWGVRQELGLAEAVKAAANKVYAANGIKLNFRSRID